MSEALTALARLKRPALLIRAARLCASTYDRDRDLGRLLGKAARPSPNRALAELMAEEAEVNETRKRGDAGYSATRHIQLLTAMMGEARILQGPRLL